MATVVIGNRSAVFFFEAFLPSLIEEQMASGDPGRALCEAFKTTDAVLRQKVGQVARASGDPVPNRTQAESYSRKSQSVPLQHVLDSDV